MEANTHIVRRDTKLPRDLPDRRVLEIDATEHVGVCLAKPREHLAHAPADSIVHAVDGLHVSLHGPTPMGSLPRSDATPMVDGGVRDQTCEPGERTLLGAQGVESRLLEGLLEHLLRLFGVSKCTVRLRRRRSLVARIESSVAGEPAEAADDGDSGVVIEA